MIINVNVLVCSFTVDLKHITSSQVLEVVYESRRRRFSVVSVSALRSVTKEGFDSLAHDLSALSVSPSSQLWAVGWDCTVLIVDKGSHDPFAVQKVIYVPLVIII
jgi:AAA family ATPase